MRRYGYRYYDIKGVVPQYPFGHGLSYTGFELSNLRLSGDVLDLGRREVLTVSVDVTNMGDRAGKEVVQLYISDAESTPHKPIKELKGFSKVYVEAGETRTVEMTIDKRSLEHYDPRACAWCVEPGVFRVLVGTSAADIRLTAEFRARGVNPYGYGPDTEIAKVMSDDRAVAVLQKHLPEGSVSRQAMGMELQYAPHRPLEAVWTSRFDRALQDRSEEERAEIKRQVYRELAAIES